MQQVANRVQHVGGDRSEVPCFYYNNTIMHGIYNRFFFTHTVLICHACMHYTCMLISLMEPSTLQSQLLTLILGWLGLQQQKASFCPALKNL